MAARSDEPGSSALFSGLVFCTTGLSVPERDPLFALAQKHGAETQVYLDDAVTHLLLRNPRGAKYEFAAERRDRMCTVQPDWIHACIEQNFLVPETDFFVGGQDTGAEIKESANGLHPALDLAKLGTKGVSSARVAGVRDSVAVGVEGESVHALRGCVFVFSGYDQQDIAEFANKLLAIDGVRVVDEDRMDEATHCIARNAEFGSRSIYRSAVVGGKVIATWYWLSACLREGALLDVGAHPLYMPLPSAGSIEGMDNLIISVTGFVGEARDLVKDMIHATGAAYTGSCFRENTHLVVKAPEGRKYASALHWGMKIVSVGWLEKCIKEWSYVSEAEFLFHDAPDEGAAVSDEPPARRATRKEERFDGLQVANDEEVNLFDVSASVCAAERTEGPDVKSRRSESAIQTRRSSSAVAACEKVQPREASGAEPKACGEQSVPEKDISPRKRRVGSPGVPAKRVRGAGLDSGRAVERGHRVEKTTRAFVFSVRDTATRRRWARAVKLLGGLVLPDAPSVPSDSPVLYIFPSLRRTVKFACACFNGDWILPADYVLASERAGSFLPEVDFSWDQPEYRKNVHSEIWPGACDGWRKRRGGPPPFAGWKVGIYGQTVPDPASVERMLVMGGAQVLAKKLPYRASALTHAVVSQDMDKDQVIQQLLEAGVQLLAPTYLMDLASREHEPDIHMYNLWK